MRRSQHRHRAVGRRVPARSSRRSGHHAAPAHRPELLRTLLPQALVVAFLAGGTSAFVALDKEVRLTVDGRPRTLHTFAGRVGELLAREGVRLGVHDTVTPAVSWPLAHGDRVVVRHARPLTLTLDGRTRRRWTTAHTVAEALRRLGLDLAGARLSLPRATAVPRHGLALAVRTTRRVTLITEGRSHPVWTTAVTVRELLERAGATPLDGDAVSAPLDGFPRDGQTIAVLRTPGDTAVLDEPIAFTTERRPTPELSRGTEVVVREGRRGVRRITYELRASDGATRRLRPISSEVVRPAEARVVSFGTGEPSSPRAEADRLARLDTLDWAALARCESSGRVDAVDPSGTYGGLYQMDLPTWRQVGGRGRPQDATAEEQTRRAKRLYVRRGASPWPVCGRQLRESAQSPQSR